jgi:hypothetical protein
MRTTDYIDIRDGPDRGGPPTINARVFEAPNTTIREWLTENRHMTNYHVSAESVTIDGVEGLLYS